MSKENRQICWFIFWLVVFWPIALIYLLQINKDSSIAKDKIQHHSRERIKVKKTI